MNKWKVNKIAVFDTFVFSVMHLALVRVEQTRGGGACGSHETHLRREGRGPVCGKAASCVRLPLRLTVCSPIREAFIDFSLASAESGGPQPLGCRPVPVCDLSGTGPHSR